MTRAHTRWSFWRDFQVICPLLLSVLIFFALSEMLRAQVIDYLPRVIVKFRNNQIDPQVPNAADQFLTTLTTQNLFWTQLRVQFPGISIQKLITVLTQNQLLGLVNRAKQLDPNYQPPNFLTFFAIPCPSPVDPNALATVLSSPLWANMVERAYVEGKPSDRFPSVSNPNQNVDYGSMRADTNFLRAAPEGIDAASAWTNAGGDGSLGNLKFVDIESAWGFSHLDLPSTAIDQTLLFGLQHHYYDAQGIYSDDHGTGVLGIVAAMNNSLLSLGITPNLSTIKVASYWVYEQNKYTPRRQEAISMAINSMSDGDVLLLEMQMDDSLIPSFKNLPVEYDYATFAIIQLGTKNRRIIVEAAGNGGYDLDNTPYVYTPWLVRATEDLDSGAILVSGATWTLPHVPVPVVDAPSQRVHNYGSRIDCYAWGENIYTTGSGNSFQTFGGTSGASAIIAGAALAVQGISSARFGGSRLTPREMRNKLCGLTISGSNSNTMSGGGTSDKIGVMPNLKAIIQNLNTLPEAPPSAPVNLRVN